jgi:hypothetical protein
MLPSCIACRFGQGLEQDALGASEGAVAFSCVGRYLDADGTMAFKLAGGPCNYAGGGLFKINPVTVIDDEGRKHTVFAFADVEQPMRHSAMLALEAATEDPDAFDSGDCSIYSVADGDDDHMHMIEQSLVCDCSNDIFAFNRCTHCGASAPWASQLGCGLA